MYRILLLGESAEAERGQGFKDSSKKDIRHRTYFLVFLFLLLCPFFSLEPSNPRILDTNFGIFIVLHLTVSSKMRKI
jgi:hypothetical protein